MTKKHLISYLAWAFGIAWVLQIAAALLYHRGNIMAYQMILMLSMFAPLMAVIFSGSGLKTLGWKPGLKKNIRYILLAWFMPACLGTAGAGLYFLIFPEAFDTSFSYIISQIGEEGIAQLEAQGITLPMYGAIACVLALVYAPFINMFPAVGEEAGWRGVMTPAFKERFGVVKGRLISGVIWGAWHWPVMILCGYEYGTGYFGEPVTGMVMFCIFAASAGTLLDWLYERTGSIWLPALGHGAINAFAGIPTMFLNPAYADRLLLGPLMIGIIGGFPMILAAVVICFHLPPKSTRSILPVAESIE